jgi:hypothetical protein
MDKRNCCVWKSALDKDDHKSGMNIPRLTLSSRYLLLSKVDREIILPDFGVPESILWTLAGARGRRVEQLLQCGL